jgi:hypothetical protein
MKRLFDSRLAPAIVVGLIGVIAVAGIAIAGPATSSKKKKGLTAAKVRAIADAQVAAAAPNLTVKSAGSAGSLKMFGHVSSTGALSNASGIGGATFSQNSYCLSGLAATPRGGEVTVDADDSGIRDFAQLGFGPNSQCPGSQAYVLIINVGTGDFTDSGFWVELWS